MRNKRTSTGGDASVERRLAQYVAQEETVAAIAQTALETSQIDEVLKLTVRRVGQSLEVDSAEILVLDADGRSLTLLAGYGYTQASVGRTQVNADVTGLAGFTVLVKEPVIVPDFANEQRFAAPAYAVENGLVSGINVAIAGHGKPYGILSVHRRTKWQFTSEDVHFLCTVANVLGAAVRAHQADQARGDSAARFAAIVNTLVDGVITIDDRGQIDSVNPAAEQIFGYSAAELVGRNVSMLMPEPYQREHDSYLSNYRRTGYKKIIGIGREVSGLRKDGRVFPLDLAVGELQVSGRRMFTGVVRDITERRRLENEILKRGADEQRRIGQDLHDGLCQQLAGIAFAVEVLRKKLDAKAASEAASIEKVGVMLDRAISQARDLARGLQPVMLEAAGLVAALRSLSQKIEEMFHVSCLFVCDGECPVYDNNVATHLFRIAQEATSNAIKHGKAKTVIVDLSRSADTVSLVIRDDGIGLREGAGETGGMGFETMNYRARVIGGNLRIQSGETGGTVITCVVRNTSAGDPSRKASHEEQTSDSPAVEDANSGRRRPSNRPRASGRTHRPGS